MDQDVWSKFTAFESIPFVQRYLDTCYRHHGFDKTEVKSYRNSYRLLYYLQHGKRHYELASLAPVELQPLLLFYGLTQLIKACLLTVDPDYPKTTAVLAHGASTRKKKKKDYTFFEDEVRIQKYGLVTHFSTTCFGLKQLEGKKFSMQDLVERIPDFNQLFADVYGHEPFFPINCKNGREVDIPSQILDDLHMTSSRFVNFLETNGHVKISDFREANGKVHLKFQGEMTRFFPTTLAGQYYAPRLREHYDDLPEILVHFLLLYNLSMICRYETEWWNELFHHFGADELPFIESFLRLTAKKMPLLTERYLLRFM
jgi:hypothetical protein